jgi:PPK2 family polyphosphate:nucleotide phosphotransferase
LQYHADELDKLQVLLQASARHAVLIIFQAVDTAGKDGMIRHVMSGVSPQGCRVASFKSPSDEETRHDFLWRAVCRLPERGQIGIFNRSYYEDVLIARVHPHILDAQHLPAPRDKGNPLWEGRYQSIRDLEAHLHRNGTHVIKFYLHLSQEEQRERLRARLDQPEKNWKLSLSDINERQFWKDYAQAYERCIAETAREESPWYIVPADDKENARIIVSSLLLRHLHSLDLAYPRPDKEQKKILRFISEKLQNGG